MTIPTYLPYFVFAGALAAVAIILYGLNRALGRRGLASGKTDADASASRPNPASAGSPCRSLSAAMGVYHVGASASPPSNTASSCPS